MKPTQICNDEQRRIEVRRKPLNGIDYIEVERASGALVPNLLVYFFGKVPVELTVDHIAIDGGVRITGVKVVDVQIGSIADADQEGFATVTVDKDGDFSTYTLRITDLPGFDEVYSNFDFTFKPDCPADLDCKDETTCLPDQGDQPEINYLVKDYQGFRQLILDRWSQIMPDWKERHVPDLGIALAEILAYTGDSLSYYQDAVATEAYLGTARQRISVRRHARLVDYAIHEGCNARALVCIETESDKPELDPADIYFVTNPFTGDAAGVVRQSKLEPLRPSDYEVFEPVASKPLRFFKDRSRIHFYTWRNHQCVLPKGATSATLLDGLPVAINEEKASPHKEPAGSYKQPEHNTPPVRTRHLDSLELGDLLVFMENRGTDSNAPPPDPLRCHAVRLTRIERTVDTLNDQPVVNIWWGAADALPFPLCLSKLGSAPKCDLVDDLYVACGNVVLVDHGRRVDHDPLPGCVPIVDSVERCLDQGHPSGRNRTPGIFRPVLNHGPLTFAQPLRTHTPASQLLRQDPHLAQPQVKLSIVTLNGVWDAMLKIGKKEQPAMLILEQDCKELSGSYSAEHGSFKIVGTVDDGQVSLKFTDAHGEHSLSATLRDGVMEGTFDHGSFRAQKRRKDTPWTSQPDLLSSGPRDNHFVVELDNSGLAHLRFGDGELGRMPEIGASAVACYRIGSGLAGNLGPNAINLMVLRNKIFGFDDLKVFNPQQAAGGTVPETMSDIKLLAPSAFRNRLERAITAEDYATLAAQNPKVQRAAAELRFTGYRYAVRVAIDPFGSESPSPDFLEEIKSYLYRYRRIGHDLEVVHARYVPLDIEIEICVCPSYLAAHVQVALLNTLGNGVLPDGRLGFFHPDNLTFGDSIYLSRLVAAAQSTAGVQAVDVSKLQRLYIGENSEIENGVLPIGPLEIGRLDSDPNFPENGRLKLSMRGGR